MKLTISYLLYKEEIIWNKEMIKIEKDENISEMKRLEFHYEAIENDYIVTWIEPMYCEESKVPYLTLHCEDNK